MESVFAFCVARNPRRVAWKQCARESHEAQLASVQPSFVGFVYEVWLFLRPPWECNGAEGRLMNGISVVQQQIVSDPPPESDTPCSPSKHHPHPSNSLNRPDLSQMGAAHLMRMQSEKRVEQRRDPPSLSTCLPLASRASKSQSPYIYRSFRTSLTSSASSPSHHACPPARRCRQHPHPQRRHPPMRSLRPCPSESPRAGRGHWRPSPARRGATPPP